MAKKQKPTRAAEASPPSEVVFHFIKSNHFRVIHVDGAWGGVTPRLQIHFALYNERPPIPQRVEHEIADDGTLAEESRDKRVSRGGLVREVETEVIMDIETAVSLANFLKEKVDEAKALLKKTRTK